jgi:hypothetical protein
MGDMFPANKADALVPPDFKRTFVANTSMAAFHDNSIRLFFKADIAGGIKLLRRNIRVGF